MKFRWRKNRPRRHGLKLPGGYRCKCCYDELRGKAAERCRVEPKSPSEYDWSKLDTGWKSYLTARERILEAPNGMVAVVSSFEKGPVRPHKDAGWNDFQNNVIDQLAKCRIVDNTPLFEAMDRMSAEIPVEEWAEAPSFNRHFTERELQNWAEQLTQEMMSK